MLRVYCKESLVSIVLIQVGKGTRQILSTPVYQKHRLWIWIKGQACPVTLR